MGTFYSVPTAIGGRSGARHASDRSCSGARHDSPHVVQRAVKSQDAAAALAAGRQRGAAGHHLDLPRRPPHRRVRPDRQGRRHGKKGRRTLIIGVDTRPDLPTDPSDRNRARGFAFRADTTTLAEASTAVAALRVGIAALRAEVEHEADSTVEEAEHAGKGLLPAMDTTRMAADVLEASVADGRWPLATYQAMLFML